ncbi:cation-translocating P-type ATPase [Patescibacteria group bacterium]
MPQEDQKLSHLTNIYAKKHKGLSQTEVESALERFGPNVLPQKPPPSSLQLIVQQLKSPLVYVLLIAAATTILLRHLSDAVIILFAVSLNTFLGFMQEKKAGDSLEALKKMIHSFTLVIRDAKVVQINTENLVPGDVVVLRQGDKMPADAKVIECNRFFASEAMLTGESVPVGKKINDEVFMGTVVSGGQALVEVLSTGEDTEIGKLAMSVQEPVEQTPLSKQLAKFSKDLSILILIITIFVFLLGLVLGKDIVDMFTTSVALAVSAVPEGLLVAMTVVLALGMQRILKRKGLVRNLTSAETLGGVTTICTDKTGTLTLGEMQVTEVVGDKDNLLVQATVANDLSDPIEIAADKWARAFEDVKRVLSRFERLDSIPFSSEHMFFTTLNKFDDKVNAIFVNGAPEELVRRSNLPEERRNEILDRVEKMSNRGMRVIGYARRFTDQSKFSKEDVKGLEWVGLLGFTDPVRQDVKEALVKTQKAGIKLVIITGDYVNTALNVATQLGLDIKQEYILQGENIKNMNSEELAQWFKKGDGEIRLLARTHPDQKLQVINALKDNGEVVAMVGDGVNDAPALHKADIGVVVNESTEVAKESSDLVLLDSSFTTIVEAVEEGRGIFDNIRKVILYLMSDAFEEILAIIFSMLMKLPLPVTASQILWINLISDAFPSLALTADPKAEDIMLRKPRPTQEPIVTGWIKSLIGIVSIAGGIFAFGLFYYIHESTGDLTLARSIAFATLGVNSLVYVFSVKTLTRPFWQAKLFENKWLAIAVLGGAVLQVTPFATVGIRNFFGLASLGWYWALVVSASIAMFFTIEISKWVFRKRLV